LRNPNHLWSLRVGYSLNIPCQYTKIAAQFLSIPS
jgi:hypothetical protein